MDKMLKRDSPLAMSMCPQKLYVNFWEHIFLNVNFIWIRLKILSWLNFTLINSFKSYFQFPQMTHLLFHTR